MYQFIFVLGNLLRFLSKFGRFMIKNVVRARCIFPYLCIFSIKNWRSGPFLVHFRFTSSPLLGHLASVWDLKIWFWQDWMTWTIVGSRHIKVINNERNNNSGWWERTPFGSNSTLYKKVKLQKNSRAERSKLTKFCHACIRNLNYNCS